jgi:hypothetical protein
MIEPEEARPRPTCTGDRTGDLGQAGVLAILMQEPFVQHFHPVFNTAPFSDEDRPAVQPCGWRQNGIIAAYDGGSSLSQLCRHRG